MPRSRLRVYYGPQDLTSATNSPPTSEVRLPLGDVLPLLTDAIRAERTWLGDFEHDQITISTDLYEVLLAYQHCRRPSA